MPVHSAFVRIACVLLSLVATLAPASTAAAEKFLGATGSVTTVTSSANPSLPGQPVTFTVAVQEVCRLDPFTPPFPGVLCHGLSDGTITLLDGGTVVASRPIGGSADFVVTGLFGGVHPITATHSGTASGSVIGSQSAVLDQVVTGPAVFSGTSATGSGTISVQLSGGGASCTFASAQLLPPPPGASPVPPVAPNAVVFPHGLLDFSTRSCVAGGTITVVVTYPAPITQASYWKYGPTPGDASPHWYTLPATISGNTATFSITDGALGDDDLVANGAIVDQGGPGLTGAVAIPTLSPLALAALGIALLAVASLARVRKR